MGVFLVGGLTVRADRIGAAAESASFRSATYDVHKCVGMDRRRDPDRIAAVIRELGRISWASR